MDIDVVPMDVDRSMNSTVDQMDSTSKESDNIFEDDCVIVENPDITYLENCSKMVSIIKKEAKDEKRKPFKKITINIPNKESKKKKYLRIMFIGALLSSITYQLWLKSKIVCFSELDMPQLELVLNKTLYGQEKATESIIKSLSNNYSHKITLFLGSTGVGKTHMANTILDVFKEFTNIVRIISPNFNEKSIEEEIVTKLSLCKKNILFVDGLARNDLDKIIMFLINLIDSSLKQEFDMHVILILNSDLNDIDLNIVGSSPIVDEIKSSHSFFQSIVKLETIMFEKLLVDHLKLCIIDSLQIENYPYSENIVEKLVKKFDVHQNECKLVRSKLSGIHYLNIELL